MTSPTPSLWIVEYSRKGLLAADGHILVVTTSAIAARDLARKLAYKQRLSRAEEFKATEVNAAFLAGVAGRAFADLSCLMIAVECAPKVEAVQPDPVPALPDPWTWSEVDGEMVALSKHLALSEPEVRARTEARKDMTAVNPSDPLDDADADDPPEESDRYPLWCLDVVQTSPDEARWYGGFNTLDEAERKAVEMLRDGYQLSIKRCRRLRASDFTSAANHLRNLIGQIDSDTGGLSSSAWMPEDDPNGPGITRHVKDWDSAVASFAKWLDENIEVEAWITEGDEDVEE